jgi:uncharacterized protein YjdB
MSRKQRYIFTALLSLLILPSFGCGDSSSGGTLTGIDIAPISPSVAVGATQQFTATGHFSNGPDQNITAQSTWNSSTTAVATIQNFGTSPGLATGVATGKTTITASFAQGSSSVQGSTDLTVTATTPVSSPRAGEGTVAIQGTGTLVVDGMKVSVSGSMSSPLSEGTHVLRTQNGRQTVLISVGGGEVASVELSEKGLILR